MSAQDPRMDFIHRGFFISDKTAPALSGTTLM